MKAKNTDRHYIDNKTLYLEMIKYRKLYLQSLEDETDRPPVPEYVGLCIYKIATKLGTKFNFSGYSYVDEMILDGIENCITYFHNFDPDKYNNPFAYFTQIIWYAFLRRIDKEKKQSLVKHRILENAIISNSLLDMNQDDFVHLSSAISSEDSEKMKILEDKFRSKKKSIKKKNLETFTE